MSTLHRILKSHNISAEHQFKVQSIQSKVELAYPMCMTGSQECVYVCAPTSAQTKNVLLWCYRCVRMHLYTGTMPPMLHDEPAHDD